MRALGITAVLVAVLTACPAKTGLGEEGQDSDFFNGKNLDNWEGLKQFWMVKDGNLLGMSFPEGISFNTFLCSKKKYKDFELSFKVRMTGQGFVNSGVQIRSEVIERKRFAVRGPQCDMGDLYWGSLYGEQFGGMMKQSPTGVVQKFLKKDSWNDYSIRCAGKHVTIKLNGETTVDAEFEKMYDEGIIAWQLHGGGAMIVAFKDIKFKELNK